MNMGINAIVSNFQLKGKYLDAAPVKVGHINDTFLLQTDVEKYVLQKINHHIFKDVAQLTSNILAATMHLAQKIDLRPGDKLLREKILLIPTITNAHFYKDGDDNYWRIYNYIKGQSYNSIDHPLKAELAGEAFGKFQFLLSDLPASQLYEIIPAFHNMKSRYRMFLNAVEENRVNRVNAVMKEIDFVKEHVKELIELQEHIDAGRIPMRITHNDTKINNILFDEHDIPVCIVDLDTIMPGSILYDFGDAIRTAANVAAEDEADLSKIRMDIGLFEAYTKGYIKAAKEFLSETEIENLALSVKYITFIMALRFLTDYIDGDRYFKIHFVGHNLQRTRAQFALVNDVSRQFSKMHEIVYKYTSVR